MLIKICGITRAEDARFCAAAGADWLGFIFHRASPRWLEPEQAAAFDSGRARRIGVFAAGAALDEIRQIMELAALDMAQLHGGQSPDFCRALGSQQVIKVLWPESYASAQALSRDLEKFSAAAAFFLFDAGSGGGHGQVFNIEILRNLIIPRPWLLAGGLTPELAKKIKTDDYHNLAGFDFNSGLETAPGVKARAKVRAALAIKGAGFDLNELERLTQ